MRDVTNTFHLYRLTLREIWNRGFWSDPEFRNWDTVDRFDAFRPALFRALALDRLGSDDCTDPAPSFRVVPNIPNLSDGTRSASVVVLKCREEVDTMGDFRDYPSDKLRRVPGGTRAGENLLDESRGGASARHRGP